MTSYMSLRYCPVPLQVTQLYMSWSSSNAAGIAPLRQLVGAQRTFIKAQQTEPATVRLYILLQTGRLAIIMQDGIIIQM